MIFYTSDLHFGHARIIEYCNRPWATAEEMDKALVENWNATVGPDDTVYVLGDVSFRNATKSRELVTRLNGHKKLIRGNHDRGIQSMLNMGFEVCAPEGTVITGDETILLVHNPEDALKKKDLKNYHLVLNGHVHDNWRTKVINGTRFINVGTDVWDFKPVTLEQLLMAPLMPEPEGAGRHGGTAYL